MQSERKDREGRQRINLGACHNPTFAKLCSEHNLTEMCLADLSSWPPPGVVAHAVVLPDSVYVFAGSSLWHGSLAQCAKIYPEELCRTFARLEKPRVVCVRCKHG